LWKQFVTFAAQVGYISSVNEFENSLKTGSVPADIPTWVAVWIMDKYVSEYHGTISLHLVSLCLTGAMKSMFIPTS
jgi:hypothetical protein